MDDFYDDELPEGAVWCDRCQGLGTANCYCGGDQCYCENYGDMECPRCDGEGFYVPTAKQLAHEAEMRTALAIALASADTHPKDGDVKQAPLVSGVVGEAETPNG